MAKAKQQQKIQVSGKQLIKKIAKKPTFTKKTYVIAACVLAVLLLGVWWFFGGGRTLGVQNSLESYLEGKYDKDFVVGRPHLSGTGIDITGSWRAQAYPKDDKSLTFEVGKDQVKERYFDGYDGIVWAREERPRVETFLKTIYKDVPKFDLTTRISAQEDDPIRGVVPSIDDAIKQYGDRFYYEANVKFAVNSMTDAYKAELRTKFMSITEYINSKKIARPVLKFVINTSEGKTHYVCIAQEPMLTDANNELADCLDKELTGKGW